jgi:hypothetical protein
MSAGSPTLPTGRAFGGDKGGTTTLTALARVPPPACGRNPRSQRRCSCRSRSWRGAGAGGCSTSARSTRPGESVSRHASPQERLPRTSPRSRSSGHSSSASRPGVGGHVESRKYRPQPRPPLPSHRSPARPQVGKCGGHQRSWTGQPDRSDTARLHALGLAACVDRLRRDPSQAQAIIHDRQPTPDGSDQRDAHGLANVAKSCSGFSNGLRLLDCHYRIVREAFRHAPSLSASSGKLATTRSCLGSGAGSGGPSAPHSSGRRTKAVR